jgi:O-antigen/teichoic acid export membrane protein
MRYAAVSFFVTAVIGFAAAVVTARVFGVRAIGEYSLIIAPWLLLIQFSSIAEQKALTRELSTIEPRDPAILGLFTPIMTFSFLLTAVAAIPVCLISIGALRGPVNQPELVVPSIVVVAGYVVFENTSWNLDAVFSAFLAGSALFWGRITQIILSTVLAVALKPFCSDVWALTWGTVLSFVFALAVRLVFVAGLMPLRFSRAVVREGFGRLPSMLSFAARLIPARLATGLTSQGGVWLLGATSTVVEVGAYARANGLAVRMNDAGYRVSEILFPALVDRHERGDAEAFRDVWGRITRVVALPLFASAAAGGAVAGGVLEIFGNGFDRAAGAFALLLVAYALGVLVLIEGQALLAIRAPGTTSVISVARAVVTLGTMWPLASLWGGAGVAIALLIGHAVAWVLQTWRLAPTLELRVGFRLASMAASITVTTAASYAVGHLVFVAMGGAIGTVVGAGVAFVTFVAVAVAVRWLRFTEIASARDAVRRRISRRRGRTARPGSS